MSDITLRDLRKTLFETLDAVKNEKMDLGRAKVVANLAQTIINPASAQVRAMNAMGRDASEDSDNFFGEAPKRLPAKRIAGAPSALLPSRAVDPLRTVKPEPTNGRSH